MPVTSPVWSTAAVRAALVRRALAAPRLDLASAVARMGFVQLDPIRAPARAQDLILRHRVHDYRAGDLERDYPALGFDEDVVYAYGIVSPAVRRLLHPRGGAPAAVRDGLHGRVLASVRRRGPTHPRDLLAEFGEGRQTNAWGGQSRSTTRALEHLHYWGLLRVARRDAGVRVYEPVRRTAATGGRRLPAAERQRRVALCVSALLGPLPEASLRGLLRLARFAVPDAPDRALVVPGLVRGGALVRGTVDGVAYVWTAGAGPGDALPDESAGDAERPVRLLAPFDPVVWDRRRVEHLWGWAYRFEAYTPAAKRQFGYYALPILWGDALVGWANVSTVDGRLDAALGFIQRRPRDRAFARALDAELAAFERFLLGGPPA
jgi:uncharacterized protein